MTVFADHFELPAYRPLSRRLADAARGLARLFAAIEIPRLRAPRRTAAMRLNPHLVRDLGLEGLDLGGL